MSELPGISRSINLPCYLTFPPLPLHSSSSSNGVSADPFLDRFKLPEAGGGGAQAAAAAAAAALSPFLGLPPPFNLPPFLPPPPPTSSSLAAATAAATQSTKDAAPPPLNPFASMDHLSLLNLARSASALQQKQSVSPPKSKSPKSPKKSGTQPAQFLIENE